MTAENSNIECIETYWDSSMRMNSYAASVWRWIRSVSDVLMNLNTENRHAMLNNDEQRELLLFEEFNWFWKFIDSGRISSSCSHGNFEMKIENCMLISRSQLIRCWITEFNLARISLAVSAHTNTQIMCSQMFHYLQFHRHQSTLRRRTRWTRTRHTRLPQGRTARHVEWCVPSCDDQFRNHSRDRPMCELDYKINHNWQLDAITGFRWYIQLPRFVRSPLSRLAA